MNAQVLIWGAMALLACAFAGMITALTLRSVHPSVSYRQVRIIAIGWIIAGLLATPLLMHVVRKWLLHIENASYFTLWLGDWEWASLTALFGAVGTGVMFWQVLPSTVKASESHRTERRDSATPPQRISISLARLSTGVALITIGWTMAGFVGYHFHPVLGGGIEGGIKGLAISVALAIIIPTFRWKHFVITTSGWALLNAITRIYS
jgi:hypothetical protein